MLVFYQFGLLRPSHLNARLYGTTQTSNGTPVARRVHVFEGSGPAGTVLGRVRLVAGTFSAPDGTWSVDYLDPSHRYHVIAYDHTGEHDPVLKLNLIPEVLE